MAGDDEIVREVRKHRAQIFREAGGTIDALYKWIKKREKADKDHVYVDLSKDAKRKSSIQRKAQRAKPKRKRAKR